MGGCSDTENESLNNWEMLLLSLTLLLGIGHMISQLTNHQVGIVSDVQAWSEKLY